MAGSSQRWRVGTLAIAPSVTTAAGSVTMQLRYSYLSLNKTVGAATAVTLPASPQSGDLAIVKDSKGDAGTNNITVAAASGNIDGAASVVIATNYGRLILIYSGSEWNTLVSTIGAVTGSTGTFSGSVQVAGLVNTSTNKVSIGGSTAAAGSATGDATVLPAGTAEVYPTTAADDTKGVRMSSSDNVTGRLIMIGNGVSNKILKVYPPTGGTINGASANAAFSSASGKGVIVVCLDATANTNTGSFLAW